MKRVIIYVHTHWDREWYREFEEFRLRLIEVTDDIINKLQNGELPVFYFDGQVSALDDYLEIYPEKKAVIIKLISEKKLFIGPFYCSADEFLTNGESLLRNFYFGIKKSKELGCSNFIAYLCDTFGHCISTEQILKACGIDKSVVWRGVGDLPADLCRNGIKTTNLIQGYFNDFLHNDLTNEKQLQGFKKYLDKISDKSGNTVLLPVGADHLKACDNISEKVNFLNKKFESEYNFVIATPFEYFASINDDERVVYNGEFLDNSKTFILPGVYSSRVDIKQFNTKCERLLNQAEMFDSINYRFYKKISRQNQLDYAYKMLVKNHAHDSIYGCSTDRVCRDVINRFENIKDVANGVICRCKRDLFDENSFSVINLTNNDFSGVTEILTTKKLPDWLKPVLLEKKRGFPDEILYDIGKIPITEDYTDVYKYAVFVQNVQSFSSKVLSKYDISLLKDVKTSKNSLENSKISVCIKNGQINITDKKHHKIYYDFIKIIDTADVGDSYNSAPIKNDSPIRAKLKSFKIYNKDIFAMAEIKFEIKIPAFSKEKRRALIKPKHEILMKIELDTNSDFAKINLEYENKSENHKLQILFNTNKYINETVSEDLFKPVKRKFDNYNINEHIPAPRGVELKTNTMPVNGFVIANGTGVISDGLKEVEIYEKSIGLTLLRAVGIISNPKNPARGTPAGPPIETPELQMRGKHFAQLGFAFPDNYSDMEKFTDYMLKPPILFRGKLDNRLYFFKDNDNIKITVIKLSKNKELVLRLVNTSNEKEICNFTNNNTQIFETDILEEKLIPTNNTLYFDANEIKTVIFQ